MAAKNSLQASERLKSRKQIDLLFLNSKSITVFPLRVVYRILPAQTHTIGAEAGVQIGFTCSKRNFKKAVSRNRGKRLLREAYRIQKHDLVAATLQQQVHIQMFVMLTSKEIPDYVLLEQKMQICLKKLLVVVQAADKL